MIATSQAFMQSSQLDSEKRAADIDGVKLSHYPSHRLTEQHVRDCALQAGELLTNRVGGAPSDATYGPSLYAIWKRASPRQSRILFDVAGRELCSVQGRIAEDLLPSMLLMDDRELVEASTAIAIKSLGITRGAEINDATLTVSRIAQALKNVFQDLTSQECSDSHFEQLVAGYHAKFAALENEPELARRILRVGLGLGPWKTIDTIDASLQTKLASMTLIVKSILNSEDFVEVR